MTKPNIFPFRFYAREVQYWAHSPKLAITLWNRIRVTLEERIGYYATDFEVLDYNKVHLFVYDLASSSNGGIGDRIYDTIVTEFTSEEKELLDAHILQKQTEYATYELLKRENDEKVRKMMEIRKELFGV